VWQGSAGNRRPYADLVGNTEVIGSKTGGPPVLVKDRIRITDSIYLSHSLNPIPRY
jgi:hypothetical protein